MTGGRVNYYLVEVKHPRREDQPAYRAECEDIIANLGMTFDEGCEFKAIWRTAAARLGNGKPGSNAVYDAEKRVHYATRSLETERQTVATPAAVDDGWVARKPGDDAPTCKSVFFRMRHDPAIDHGPYLVAKLDWDECGAGTVVAYKPA